MKNPTTWHKEDVRSYVNKLSKEERVWLYCFINGVYGANPKSLERINALHLYEDARANFEAAHRDICNCTAKERENHEQPVRKFKNAYTALDYLPSKDLSEVITTVNNFLAKNHTEF